MVQFSNKLIVLESSTVKQDELLTYKQQTEDLKTELNKKERECNSIKRELEEKEKLAKEVNDNCLFFIYI